MPQTAAIQMGDRVTVYGLGAHAGAVIATEGVEATWQGRTRYPEGWIAVQLDPGAVVPAIGWRGHRDLVAPLMAEAA